MAISPTYPGVYIDEVPSAVHAIVGVPTAVAGFVGPAARGPADTPVHCNSWADYQRAFGGLDASSPLSWAVYMFFINGGGAAEVVRAGAMDGSLQPARIKLSDDITLTATSPGQWGNALSVKVDTDNLRDPRHQVNLAITDNGTGATERYTGLGLTPGPLSMSFALASSQLMNVDPSSGLTKLPAPGTYEPPAAEPPAAAAAGKAAAPDAAAPAGAGTVGGARGSDIGAGQLAIPGDPGAKTGMYALVKADIFNMLCLPTSWTATYPNDLLGTAASFCAQHRAMLIIDPPTSWSKVSGPLGFGTVTAPATEAVTGADIANAAIYYPNLQVRDPQSGALVQRGPCGTVAGVWASTDASRGVWKAPAGMAAALTGVAGLVSQIDDGESGVLNPLAVNCLRSFPLAGPVVWGARTAAGADDNTSSWKYIPVRRTALFIEESLYRGTRWVVFEPNAEPLWAAIRLNVGAFMNSLFQQGAFQGTTPAQAYLVQCDADNNPQVDIDNGIVNILVGFAPLVPAEFVFIHIEQISQVQA